MLQADPHLTASSAAAKGGKLYPEGLRLCQFLAVNQKERFPVCHCAKRLRQFANIGGGCGSACAEQPAFVCPANFSGQNKMMSQRTPDAAVQHVFNIVMVFCRRNIVHILCKAAEALGIQGILQAALAAMPTKSLFQMS